MFNLTGSAGRAAMALTKGDGERATGVGVGTHTNSRSAAGGSGRDSNLHDGDSLLEWGEGESSDTAQDLFLECALCTTVSGVTCSDASVDEEHMDVGSDNEGRSACIVEFEDWAVAGGEVDGVPSGGIGASDPIGRTTPSGDDGLNDEEYEDDANAAAEVDEEAVERLLGAEQVPESTTMLFFEPSREWRQEAVPTAFDDAAAEGVELETVGETMATSLKECRR
ncbi:hypothetical protein TRVL_01195 [Trypanosoma vivax]|nr:hypothetical protein TRVL_01195 [Trypanosoma vivax]